MAMRHSRRHEIHRVIRTKKMISARWAWLVISSPQVGPTVLTFTSSVVLPARSARMAVISRLRSMASTSASTRRMVVPSALVTTWMVAPPWPTSPRASRASSTPMSVTGTSHTPPPSKSMPRLRPRVKRLVSDTRTTIPAMARPGLNRRTKSKSLVPL